MQQVMDEARYKPLSTLKPWGENYRRGNVEAIAKSLRSFGYNAALRVKDDVVYAGNHAYKALVMMRDAGEGPPRHIIRDPEGEWLVPTVDIGHLEDQECIAFAIADNRTQELGENDTEALFALMGELDSAGIDSDLYGYSNEEVATLMRDLAGEDAANDPAAEWIGMPEFNQQNARAYRSLIVHFRDEDAVQKFSASLGQELTPTTRYLWYPEMEIDSVAHLRYVRTAAELEVPSV